MAKMENRESRGRSKSNNNNKEQNKRNELKKNDWNVPRMQIFAKRRLISGGKARRRKWPSSGRSRDPGGSEVSTGPRANFSPPAMAKSYQGCFNEAGATCSFCFFHKLKNHFSHIYNNNRSLSTSPKKNAHVLSHPIPIQGKNEINFIA